MKTLKITGFIALVLLGTIACQDANLEDFDLQGGKGVQVATGSIIGSIIKTNESLTIPVSLKLDGKASNAFEVGLRVNQDTVEKLIQQGTLNEAIAIPSGAILIDNVAKVSYGADAAQFQITVSRTEVERYFGKKVAIGYSIDHAGKGNSIDQTQNTGIIVINTSELLSADDIHHISFQTGGNIIKARERQNYSSTSGGISIPLTANLASFPGASFAIDIVTDADTIQQMVSNGTLPDNTVSLNEGQFTVGAKITFSSNSSEETFALEVPWTTINTNQGKQLAIVVRLKNPTLHVLNPEKSFTTILIDCDNVLEEDVTHLGVLSVSRDQPDGPNHKEGSSKMVDNSVDTKFLQPNFVGDLVCTLVFAQPQKIGAYTLSSANDDDRRDPKDWNLQGSNDGVNWTTVDSRSGETFTGRKMTRRFNVAYPTLYTHYRLNITATKGGTTAFQIAEWRMIKVR